MSGFLPVDVRGVVPMSAAIDAMAWAFEAVSLGLADMPTRIHMHPAGTDNTHIFMPVYLPDSPCGRYPAVITCKAVSIIPANRGTELPVTIGMVMAIDPKTGAVTELFHGGSLTAVRTGAAAGLATRLLAESSWRPYKEPLVLHWVAEVRHGDYRAATFKNCRHPDVERLAQQ